MLKLLWFQCVKNFDLILFNLLDIVFACALKGNTKKEKKNDGMIVDWNVNLLAIVVRWQCNEDIHDKYVCPENRIQYLSLKVNDKLTDSCGIAHRKRDCHTILGLAVYPYATHSF